MRNGIRLTNDKSHSGYHNPVVERRDMVIRMQGRDLHKEKHLGISGG